MSLVLKKPYNTVLQHRSGPIVYLLKILLCVHFTHFAVI